MNANSLDAIVRDASERGMLLRDIISATELASKTSRCMTRVAYKGSMYIWFKNAYPSVHSPTRDPFSEATYWTPTIEDLTAKDWVVISSPQFAAIENPADC